MSYIVTFLAKKVSSVTTNVFRRRNELGNTDSGYTLLSYREGAKEVKVPQGAIEGLFNCVF